MRFDALEDLLLRGGIAPRHVKRYLTELSEHLADLTQAQREAGFDQADAASRARAALGPDQELADAMLKQRDFRSLSARFPWLVFGVLPPLAVIAGFVAWVLAMVLIGFAGGVIPAHHKIPLPVPAWYALTASGLIFASNFLIAPLLAFGLAWMAQRQRMKPLWPLLGMVVILLVGFHGDFHADTKNISIGLGTNGLFSLLPFYPAKGPFGPRGMMHWPLLLEQAALLCLPAAWLIWMRRPLAKVPVPS